MKNKRGQILGIPFQLIFSIILIVVFLYVAITSVRSFLQTKDAMSIANFVTDFRSDLEKTMATTESSVMYKYYMPSGVKYACFTANTDTMKVNSTYFSELSNYRGSHLQNQVFFYPLSYMNTIKTKAYAKVDCEKSCLNLAALKNPYCIPNINGIVNVTIYKIIGDANVKIK